MEDRKAGYFRLYRKAMDQGDPFWREKPFGRWRARLDLIGLASFNGRVVKVGGEKVTLARGEFFTSHSFLVNRWGWSVKKVRSFVARLQRDGFMIEACRYRSGTVWRITKYDQYQSENGEN